MNSGDQLEMLRQLEMAMRWAEDLIGKLCVTGRGRHDGAESWLLNNGIGPRAVMLRDDWARRNPDSTSRHSDIRAILKAQIYTLRNKACPDCEGTGIIEVCDPPGQESDRRQEPCDRCGGAS